MMKNIDAIRQRVVEAEDELEAQLRKTKEAREQLEHMEEVQKQRQEELRCADEVEKIVRNTTLPSWAVEFIQFRSYEDGHSAGQHEVNCQIISMISEAEKCHKGGT